MSPFEFEYDRRTLHLVMAATHSAGLVVFSILAVLSLVAVYHHIKGLVHD